MLVAASCNYKKKCAEIAGSNIASAFVSLILARIFKRDFVISKCYVFDDFLTSMEFSYVQDAQKECEEK